MVSSGGATRRPPQCALRLGRLGKGIASSPNLRLRPWALAPPPSRRWLRTTTKWALTWSRTTTRKALSRPVWRRNPNLRLRVLRPALRQAAPGTLQGTHQDTCQDTRQGTRQGCADDQGYAVGVLDVQVDKWQSMPGPGMKAAPHCPRGWSACSDQLSAVICRHPWPSPSASELGAHTFGITVLVPHPGCLAADRGEGLLTKTNPSALAETTRM